MFLCSCPRRLARVYNVIIVATATLALLSLSPLALSQQHNAARGNGQLGHHLQPGLGRTVDNIADSIVSPDGSALPVGSGSVAAGKVIYAARCSACHGSNARQKGNALVGGMGTLATDKPVKSIGSFWPYATTLFDYIARAMPYGQEKSLTASEVYALTAYLLHLNKIVDVEAVIDRERLPLIIMPNRHGFIELHH